MQMMHSANFAQNRDHDIWESRVIVSTYAHSFYALKFEFISCVDSDQY